MSDELRLPDELAACEARLAAMPLAASRIDRDELMYRAGWAAGVAGVGTTRLASVNPPPSKGWEQTSTGDPKSPERRAVVPREAIRGGILAASIMSAAVAASLAVAITLQWRPSAEPTAPVAAEVVHHEPPAPQVAAAAPRVRPAAGQRVSTDFGSRSLAPLLAMRRQELSRLIDGSPVVADAAVYVQPTPAKTARQLLEELLPESIAKPLVPSPSRFWPFGSANLGETI